MDNLKDEVNIELDRRRVESLIEQGVVSIEDIARAPIIRAEPSCKCGKGLEMNDAKFGHFPHAELACPECKAPSTDIYLCRLCGKEVEAGEIKNEDVCLDCFGRYV
jgi:hypothetical protein